jgi:hypothetical protein
MMNLTGTITGLQRDFESGKPVVLLRVEENLDGIDDLMGKTLDVVLKIFRKKRSRDANAYFHVLADKIAKKMGRSNDWTKNYLLARYGQRYYVDGRILMCYFPEILDVSEDPKNHFAPTDEVEIINGRRCCGYQLVRGSHTYDTKEMSQLIDGTVQEAKDLNIETLSPDDLKRMYAAWGEAHA